MKFIIYFVVGCDFVRSGFVNVFDLCLPKFVANYSISEPWIDRWFSGGLYLSGDRINVL